MSRTHIPNNPIQEITVHPETHRISACWGNENNTLAKATNLISSISEDFADWGLVHKQPYAKPTDVMKVDIKGDNILFSEILHSLNICLDSMVFTQKQIIRFLERNPDAIRNGGTPNMFIFSKTVDGQEHYFLANIFLFGGELTSIPIKITNDYGEPVPRITDHGESYPLNSLRLMVPETAFSEN